MQGLCVSGRLGARLAPLAPRSRTTSLIARPPTSNSCNSTAAPRRQLAVRAAAATPPPAPAAGNATAELSDAYE